MSLPQAFEPFVKGAPCCVLARLAVDWLMDDDALQAWFDEAAVDQYEREFTLANLVDVMLDVASGKHRSPRAAFLARQEDMPASLSAFYGKLNRSEPAVSATIVERTAAKAKGLIDALGGGGNEPVEGFETCVLDGNMLAGSEHRLAPLRNTRAAALPGKSLVVFECATQLVSKVVLWEDAHSQERALLPDLELMPGKHWLADRNFCVAWFLHAIAASGSHFTIRRHRSFSLSPEGERSRARQTETGLVYEQKLRMVDPQGRTCFWRMIVLELDAPTRDGENEIVLISNMPRTVKAETLAMAYRQRWTIEHHLQRLTDCLHCELPSLAYPRAALFAFGMSVLAGNALAILMAAIRSALGDESADNLSYHALVDEVAGTYRGMMLALPPPRWNFARNYDARNMARLMRDVAKHVNMRRLRKSIRGPKKPKRTPNCKRIRHISTFRVLAKNKP